MTEIEELKAQIKVLTDKLDLLTAKQAYLDKKITVDELLGKYCDDQMKIRAEFEAWKKRVAILESEKNKAELFKKYDPMPIHTHPIGAPVVPNYPIAPTMPEIVYPKFPEIHF